MKADVLLKHREVRLSLLSLVGQIGIISLALAELIYGDVSSQRASALVIVIIGFVLVLFVTLKRLAQLAKLSDTLNI